MAENRPVGLEEDLLHPLATLYWGQCHTWKEGIKPKHCAVLHNIVVLLDSSDKLHISTNLRSWTTTRAPVKGSSLTTYKSKFVLIGGRHYSSDEVTNQLWTSTTGLDWETSLPVMPTKRYSTSSVSGGSPEVLVVAGGQGSDGSKVDVVEVLLDDGWTTTASLPTQSSDMRSTFHEGNFYFTGGDDHQNILYTCSCDSLIALARKRKTTQQMWKMMEALDDTVTIASCSSRLIKINRCSTICGYSITPQMWLTLTNEGDVPKEDSYHSSVAVLFTGQLVTANTHGVYKGTLSVSTFDPDTRFISNVLSRLEAVMGVQIVPVLANYHFQLTITSGVKLQRPNNRALPDPGQDPILYTQEIILQWSMGHSHRPPTWKQLLDAFQDIGLTELSQQIESFMGDYYKFENAFKYFIDCKDVLEFLSLKFMFLGPPRLGKSTTRRRVMKEIVDLYSAEEIDQVHGSTETVECCPNMLVQDKPDPATAESKVDLTIVQNLADEACLLFHSLKNSLETESNPDAAATSLVGNEAKAEGSQTSSTVLSHPVEHSPQPNLFQRVMTKIKSMTKTMLSRPQHSPDASPSYFGQTDSLLSADYSETAAIFKEVSRQPKFAEYAKHSFQAFLRIEDTGGQPELMDMLPALTIGPGLYLLFFSYEFKLDEEYQVFYQRDSGETTSPEKSEFTLQEMLLSMLASISCSSASTVAQPLVESRNSEIDEILQSSKSVAYIVGTHKDKVSEEYISTVDMQLQRIIRDTEFYKRGIVQFCSEDKLVVPLDNMRGGVEEIYQLDQLLESAMKKHFKKLKIPAVWLLFSLCLRMRDVRTASMETCFALSNAFNMTPYETKVALWFLHHHASVLMYFPDVAGLEDLVIIDIQVVYDSITSVILRAMSFDSIGQAKAERFRKTGRFTLKDLKSGTDGISGDLIVPNQLVALLAYLNIIAQILSDESLGISDIDEREYIMPCVLESTSSKELDLFHKESCLSSFIAPLFIHFTCGFTPMGLFPAVMAGLISNKSFFLVEEGMKKNMAQFLYGSKPIRVTFISRSMFYEIVVSCDRSLQSSIHRECTALKREIKNTLKQASSRMNYSSYMDFKFAFECYSHEEENHLGIVYGVEDIPSIMICAKDPQGMALQNKHLIWYGQEYNMQHASVTPEKENYLSVFLSMYPDLVISLKPCVMDVADHCYSIRLISDDVYDQLTQNWDWTDTDKARLLLGNIRKVLLSTPASLYEFLSVLLQVEECYEVAKKMQQKLQ